MITFGEQCSNCVWNSFVFPCLASNIEWSVVKKTSYTHLNLNVCDTTHSQKKGAEGDDRKKETEQRRGG